MWTEKKKKYVSNEEPCGRWEEENGELASSRQYGLITEMGSKAILCE